MPAVRRFTVTSQHERVALSLTIECFFCRVTIKIIGDVVFRYNITKVSSGSRSRKL